MILRSSPASPFVRKVRIAIALLGFAGKIDVRETDLNDPADSIRQQNPLGKIPALVLDDGGILYDSRVILEYLDHLAGGGKIVPREPAARFAALRLQALCDGVLDASVLIVYENRYRPEEQRVQGWIDRQAGKVKRALDTLEAAPPKLDANARCRADRARLRARLSRFPLRRRLAQGLSAPARLARQLRRASAGLRRHQADRITDAGGASKSPGALRGFACRRAVWLRSDN